MFPLRSLLFCSDIRTLSSKHMSQSVFFLQAIANSEFLEAILFVDHYNGRVSCPCPHVSWGWVHISSFLGSILGGFEIRITNVVRGVAYDYTSIYQLILGWYMICIYIFTRINRNLHTFAVPLYWLEISWSMIYYTFTFAIAYVYISIPSNSINILIHIPLVAG